MDDVSSLEVGISSSGQSWEVMVKNGWERPWFRSQITGSVERYRDYMDGHAVEDSS